MYNLLIIDMQPEFSTSEQCLPEVLYLIIKAKKDKANIINVEYFGNGNSYKSIQKELKNYTNTITIVKNGDNGGEEIYSALIDKNWLNKPIFVCGVNLDACIKETLNGLINKFKTQNTKLPDIYIIFKACNHNYYDCNISYTLSNYPKEVKIIKNTKLPDIEKSINSIIQKYFLKFLTK